MLQASLAVPIGSDKNFLIPLPKLFKINNTRGKVTGPFGNQVVTFGLDNPEKLKSETPINGVFTDAIIEEATESKPEALEQINKRLRGKIYNKPYPGFQKRVVLLFNPIHKTHWIYEKFFNDSILSRNITMLFNKQRTT